MSAPIKRVAQAIYACQQESIETPWENASGPVQENWIDTARAAIAAMDPKDPQTEARRAALREMVQLDEELGL